MSRKFLLAWILSLLCVRVASAEELVWATGKVFTDDGRTPLSDAIVAVYDDRYHVIDYAKTGPDGAYTLTIPRHALHLTRVRSPRNQRLNRGGKVSRIRCPVGPARTSTAAAEIIVVR